MCDFVSWIDNRKRGKAHKVWFLTDRECRKYLRENPTRSWEDVIGHNTLRMVMPEACGEDCEATEKIPPIIAQAIMAGKMRGMMKVAGYKKLVYNAEGQLHNLRGPALIYDVGGNMYFIHGTEYSEEGWKAAKKRMAKRAAAKKAKVTK